MTKQNENLNLLEMDEAIKLLKTSRPTFYRWLKSGKIKGTKVGRKWKFQKSDIERFIKGETPKVNVPVDITPLLNELKAKLTEKGVSEDIAPIEFDDLETCVLYIVALAFAGKASDIHIGIQREEFKGEQVGILRMRIFSQLKIISKFNPKLVRPIIDVWKSWSELDINKSNVPQDGRFIMEFDDNAGSIAGGNFTLLNQVVPSIFGESLTARVLNVESWIALSSLQDIGFTDEETKLIKKNLEKSHGLVLSSGPGGSGKTTTLYQFLKELIASEKKILTIENPVEIIFPWATQIPINSKEGFTFAKAIKHALRSDPDVIMVSETPTKEATELLIEAATSGHLTLGQFHAYDTFEMLKRIMETGKDNLYQVIDSINLLTSQRLAKKLCPDCKKEAMLTHGQVKVMEEVGHGLVDLSKYIGEKIYTPVGCDNCIGGYKGRVVYYEILEMNAPLTKGILKDASIQELMEIGIKNGVTPLIESGLKRVIEGLTTIEEITNVLK